MDNEPGAEIDIAVKEKPTIEFTTTPPEEYIVGKERADGIVRLMDTIGEDAPLTPDARASLISFENKLIEYEEKARAKGKPVGIDYFSSYKQGFKDKFVAIGGAAALAVLIPIVLKMQEGTTYIDPDTGEEKQISLFYVPDGKKGSEVLKFQTQDPKVRQTEEQKEIATQFGKPPDDKRVIEGMEWLRKLSLDEVPQAFTVGWKEIMNLIGPRSLHRMAERAKTEKINKQEVRYDLKYPELYQVYEEAISANVTKGLASGYTAVADARGGSLFTQFAADAILMRHASEYSENYILARTLITAISQKGAK